MDYLVVFAFMLVVVFLFIGTYILNQKTPPPDIEVDMGGCRGCHSINCGHNPNRNNTKEVK